MFTDDQTLGRGMVDVHVTEAATVVRDNARPSPAKPAS
jgi:hypothetical protein